MKKDLLLQSLLLLGLLLALAACQQTSPTIALEEKILEESNLSIFDSTDLAYASHTVTSNVIELNGTDLNNEEINIEGTPAPEEENSDLATQAVLAGADGHLVYYRQNNLGTYEIWMSNQSDDSKVNVYSGSNNIQSVAVDGTGNWVAASIINPAHGEYDVYLFDIAGSNMHNLTNTNNKDELDVSMTANGKKIVYSKPTNTGLSKINICDYDVNTNSCTVSILGATDNQRQASITENGNYIALIRDINPNVQWRVLLYDTAADTYTIVTTRFEELSHPSATVDGKNIMYLRDRTTSIGKYLVRVKNLDTNVIDNELSKPELGHPHVRPNMDFFTYRDEAANGFTRAFTRNIATNQRASAQAGSWNYYQPYWQAPILPVIPTNVIVVDKDATGNNNGTSWVDAYSNLQDALDCVGNGTNDSHCNGRTFDTGYDEIWVASGAHYPDEGLNQTNNLDSESFIINNDGTKIYGGFDGVGAGGIGGTQETQRDQRNPDPVTNGTILSGDIQQNDAGVGSYSGSNSERVVRMPNNFEALSDETILDGFEITKGHADDGFGNQGAGLMCDAPLANRWCEVTLHNLYFYDNRAHGANNQGDGGALYFESARPDLYNIKFYKNTARRGGAMYLEDSILGFSTADANRLGFYSNDASQAGGAIYSEDSEGTLLNSLFTKNTSFNGGGAIYIDFNFDGNSRWNIYSNTFHDNDSTLVGGAITIFSTGENSRILQIANSMFTNNNAGIDGNDLYTNMDSVSAEVFFDTNRSNAGDVFDAGAGSTTIVNNFTAGVGYVDANGVDNILGNLDDNYTLNNTSTGIDDGKSNYGAGTEDYLGNDRSVDGDNNGSNKLDIGAYERQ